MEKMPKGPVAGAASISSTTLHVRTSRSFPICQLTGKGAEDQMESKTTWWKVSGSLKDKMEQNPLLHFELDMNGR